MGDKDNMVNKDNMVKKIKWRKVMLVIGIIGACVCIILLGMSLYGRHKLSKLPGLSFQEALEYTTEGKEDAVITVGIIKDGQISYTVYGENGSELTKELHTYEIGSLTKTFTSALINKAANEGKLDLESTIDRYLSLPKGKGYPTIKELLTHTSGYKSYYFESIMLSNFFKGRNDFYGITKDMVLGKAGELNLDKESYSFVYSNYGYAVLGLLLESVYEKDYTSLMNEFIHKELGLVNTRIADKEGDLGNYWDWKEQDAYLSAGALTSDIADMLAYAQMQLENSPYFTECHKSLKVINASTKQYELMGIHMDEIGMAWIIDKENEIIWHNGGTGAYNSYLGFQPEAGVAVVVLSNLPPNDRIPATVLGVKVFTELGY